MSTSSLIRAPSTPVWRHAHSGGQGRSARPPLNLDAPGRCNGPPKPTRCSRPRMNDSSWSLQQDREWHVLCSTARGTTAEATGRGQSPSSCRDALRPMVRFTARCFMSRAGRSGAPLTTSPLPCAPLLQGEWKPTVGQTGHTQGTVGKTDREGKIPARAPPSAAAAGSAPRSRRRLPCGISSIS